MKNFRYITSEQVIASYMAGFNQNKMTYEDYYNWSEYLYKKLNVDDYQTIVFYGKEYLKTVGSTMLMTMKPETQGLTGSVKVGVKQGDKTINYVKMSYHEAKKFAKEAAEDVEIDETESAQK